LDIDNLTPEEFKKMLEGLPENAKEIMSQFYLKNLSTQPLIDIKEWLDSYSNSCPLDALLLNVVHQFIGLAGQEIAQSMIQRQKQGFDYYSGQEAMNIACNVLNRIIKDMKNFSNETKNKNH
jgi:Ser/Thr protein kinase RdoA (MazF antagonist)